MGTIHEHEMIKTKLEIQEQAQKNIIQDIHDNIGQILSLAKLHLATLDFTKPEEVAQKTFNSNQLLSKAIKDLRNLTKYLDAEHINHIGISRSLEYELGFLPKGRVTEPVLTVTGNPITLSKEEELILFRIIQELTSWLIKKSSTSILSVRIQCQLSVLVIRMHAIERAGRIKEPDHEDLVIKQLRERSGIIGADLQIDDKGNHETIVSIALPLHNH